MADILGIKGETSERLLLIVGLALAAYAVFSPRITRGTASPITGSGAGAGIGGQRGYAILPLLPQPIPVRIEPMSQDPWSPDWIPIGSGAFPPTDDPYSPSPGYSADNIVDPNGILGPRPITSP